VRFETTQDAATTQATAVADLCARHGAVTTIVDGKEEAAVWSVHEERVSSARGTLLRVAVLPTDVLAILDVLAHSASVHRIEWRAGGRAALGVLDIHLSNPVDHHAAVVSDLRRAVETRGGSVVVKAGADAVVDRWGPMGDAWPLMRAVKARFDPRNTLNPGSGPGGL
jgi:FAD/FMN-containing dehydrogenase